MNQKRTIKIKFLGFWPSLIPTDNFFYNLLVQHYDVEISDQPDILFYSDGKCNHGKYTCTKVYYTGENIAPDFAQCDFAFSFRPTTERNYRLPLYALYHDVKKMLHRQIDAASILGRKTKFCCFLVSNGACTIRNDFFTALSAYKHVDSGGRFMNNIGFEVIDKHAFIKDYKFVIAFENTSYPGYTTEKIYEPLIQHCVPIYWGDPNVSKDFNTGAFVNSHDYPSFEKVIERVIEVDNDDELYKQYLSAPVFPYDKLTETVKDENILQRLDEIVDYHFSGRHKLRQKFRPAYFALLAAAGSMSASAKFVINLPVRALNKLRRSNAPKVD